MTIDVTLKNYRCFSDGRPARFQVRPGLTALVGKNNSGKSSILKFLYEFRGLFQMLASHPNNFLQALNGRSLAFNLARTITDTREVFHNGNERDLTIEISLGGEEIPSESPYKECRRCELIVPRGTNTFTCRLRPANGDLDLSKGQVGIHPDNVSLIMQEGVARCEVAFLQEAFGKMARTLYIAPFRNAVNLGTHETYFDIQVGQAFIQTWKNFKSGNQGVLNEAAYKLEKEIQHIFELSDLQINVAPNDQTLQLFLNGKSFKLSEVGAGIAQFIVVLANVAMQNPTYILLDEPELGLHPSLQVDFLTTLASYAPQGGILFATHNIGLARVTAQQVLAVEKQSDFESSIRPLEAMPRLSEFLGELSFGGYREIGFDKVLLVEGPTDVLAVQQLLRLYGKDHRVLLLHMGGNSLISDSQATEVQLQEVKRISEHTFALIDSEKGGSAESLPENRRAFQQLCQRAGIDCHVLERRATENYWTDRALQKVKGPSVPALQHFENLKLISPSWPKRDNWLIAREMTKDEVDQTDLGRFLDAL
jgi:ABC-type cobalamin/Fe3+-siderophores transport system ATPase subunit